MNELKVIINSAENSELLSKLRVSLMTCTACYIRRN